MRFFALVLIGLLLVQTLPALIITRSINFHLIPESSFTEYHVYFHEAGISQLSEELFDYVNELILKEPARVRRRIDLTSEDLVRVIPFLIDIETNKEVLYEDQLSLHIVATIDDKEVIKRLLALNDEERYLFINYRRDVRDFIVTISALKESYHKADATTRSQILKQLQNEIRHLNIEHRLFSARLSLLKREFQAALDFTERVFLLDENNSQAHWIRYQTYSTQNRGQQATESLKLFLEQEPDNKTALHIMGDYWRDKDDISKAVHYYERLIDQDSSYPLVTLFLGDYYHNRGEYLQAVRYAQLTSHHLKEPSPYDLELASLLVSLELYDDASLLLQSVLLQSPREAKAFKLLGHILCLGKESYRAALQFYERTLSLEPYNEEALFYSGFCFFQIESFTDAITALYRLVEINPDYQRAYYYLANSLFRAGFYTNAIEVYNKALEYDPTSPQILFELGNSYFAIANYETSLVYYQEAIDKQHDFIEAIFNVANTYHKLENWDKALTIYDRVLEQDSLFYKVYYNIGNYHLSEGQLETAITYYQKAIEINENDEYSYSNMGDCYRMLGMFDEAIEAYKKSISLNPHNPIPYNNLSMTYYLMEDFLESLDYLRKAAELGHHNAINILGEIRH